MAQTACETIAVGTRKRVVTREQILCAIFAERGHPEKTLCASSSRARFHTTCEAAPKSDPLVQCQNSASRMMTGSGTPKSQRRMPLPMIRSLYRAGREDAVVPRTVAQHAA